MNNNYVSTEKSLKRWLKSRVKITMATVVGFLIAGTVAMGAEITEKITIDGAVAEKVIKSNDVNMILNGTTALNGIFVSGVNLTDKTTFHELDVQSNKINIDVTTTTGDATGVYIANGGKVTLGTSSTESIVINTKTQSSYATGLQSIGNTFVATGNESGKQIIGGPITVNGKFLDIVSNSESGLAAGIWTQTNTFYSPEELKNKIADGTMIQSGVTLNTGKTTITVNSNEDNRGIGIAVFSNSLVEVKGDLEIKQYDDKKTKEYGIIALDTRGHSTIKINENCKNTVKLDGDIVFDRADTPVESNVILNLSNKESVFTGGIYTDYNPDKIGPDGSDLKYSGMKLGLSNGATWNVTGDSLVNDLTLDGGVINIAQTEETGNVTEHEKGGDVGDYTGLDDSKTVLNIDNLSGEGTVTFESKIEGKEVEVAEANLRIRESTAKGTNLKVGLSGVNTDDLAQNNISAEKALGELTDKVVNKDNQRPTDIKQTLFVEGGALTGEATAELDANGKLVNVKQEKETPITASVRDLAVINYLSWKQEMGSLTQRMGELRDSSAEHGVWSRVYGGKVENGSQYDNKYQTYQVGYDKKYSVDNGRVYLGYLVSYTDGETDYTLGHGENYSVGAGIYATWMNNNGHYADVLYKVSRLNNKFTVNDVEKFEGDYDNFGISLSAEYGKRFDLGEKWFAEPNVGMHLGQLSSETYTTNTGIEVSQDSIYTAEGRVGAAIGYKFSDKGNVYAKTHVVKEFAGDVDTEFERNGVHAKVSEDMGDTWLEFGIGANYRFTENMNVYADIEKTGDSTVDTKWQANLGFRYEF